MALNEIYERFSFLKRLRLAVTLTWYKEKQKNEYDVTMTDDVTPLNAIPHRCRPKAAADCRIAIHPHKKLLSQKRRTCAGRLLI